MILLKFLCQVVVENLSPDFVGTFEFPSKNNVETWIINADYVKAWIVNVELVKPDQDSENQERKYVERAVSLQNRLRFLLSIALT